MTNSKKPKVVLVDKNDKVIGYKDKIEAHKNPVPLHRAVSIVIFDKKGERILIHKRSSLKRTWPSYWTNPCCTDVLPEETYKQAASRRLKEEMGIETPLKEVFSFTYKAKYNKTWGEHEIDHVFVGNYEGKILPNEEEVDGYEWLNLEEFKNDLKKNPQKYTPWFRIIVKKLKLI